MERPPQTSDFGELMRGINARKREAMPYLLNDENHYINTFVPIPRIINGYKATVLGHSISMGDIELIQKCIKRGTDPNLGSLWYDKGEISNEKHAMTLAAGKGDKAYEIIQILLEAGATPSHKDINEMFFKAVWALNVECVKWCLNNGADSNYIPYPRGPTRFILMCYRWKHDRTDEYIKAARELIKGGADWKYCLKESCQYDDNNNENENEVEKTVERTGRRQSRPLQLQQQQRVTNIPILSLEERQQLLIEWNDSECEWWSRVSSFSSSSSSYCRC